MVIVEASDVVFNRMIRSPVRTGRQDRSACGRVMRRRISEERMPIDFAASICPRGIALIAPRMTSAL
ncbi:hypothetical protein D3C87_2088220 [compost metagenome]